MSHRDHVEIGKATNLHYSKHRHGSGGAVALTYRPQSTYPAIKETRRPTSRPSSSRPPRRGGFAAIAVVALFVVLLLGAGIGGWHFFLRDIKLTVNGQDVTARINTPLANLLADNDYFGVQPGRLLSITGNVIDEQGGVLCAVTYNGEGVAEEDFAGTLLKDGDEVAVGNGTDVEEPNHEEEAPLAPGIQKERGGAVQFVSQWGKAGKKTVRRGERSGETVDVEVVEPATDMIVSSINLNPQGGPYIALTFDDGPSKYTPEILRILKEKNAVATFFNLGSQASGSPDRCRAIVDAGCELASHTNAHQNLPTLDRDALRQEISSAADALEQASGVRPQMIRAPYGAFTEVEWARAGDIISTNVLWNIDTLDWERPGAAAITSAVLNGARNGSIVLMHDGGGNREQDIEALPGIIDGLRERGYTLVTVSELMRLDGRVPEEVIEGTVSLPEGAVMPEV